KRSQMDLPFPPLPQADQVEAKVEDHSRKHQQDRAGLKIKSTNQKGDQEFGRVKSFERQEIVLFLPSSQRAVKLKHRSHAPVFEAGIVKVIDVVVDVDQ